jgi:signal transduction histidine kinase/DNA-binding response OmpR family regulator
LAQSKKGILKKRTTDERHREIIKLVESGIRLMDSDAAKAISFFEKAIPSARQEFPVEKLFPLLLEVAGYFIRLKSFKQALLLSNEALQIGESLSHADCIYRSYELLIDIHFLTGNFSSAIEYGSRLLEQAMRMNDELSLAGAHNRLGELYKVHTNYHKALEHHLQALAIYEKHQRTGELSRTHFYLGNCYNWLDELEMAGMHLSQSLELATEAGDPRLRAHPLGSLAILYNKKKDFVKALECFHQSINLAKIFNDVPLQINLRKSFGRLYIDLGQYDRAIDVLEETLESIALLPGIYPAHLIHQYLSEAYEKVGDYQKALYHHKMYMELCSRINNEQITLKITELELHSEINRLARQKEIAEKTSQIKDHFISGISHELRTPLNGIFGMLELLNQTQLTAEQAEYVKTIRLSSTELLSIINDLIDYSEINQGVFALKPTHFRLKDRIAEIVADNLAKASEKKIQLHLKLAEDLPFMVTGDEQRLAQLLNNLITNGIKFTSEGSVSVEVSVMDKKNDRVRLLFQVSDTGCGIKSEWLPYIFESYACPALLQHPQSGSGLGLSVVKSLVEKQGGKIDVSSITQKGTVVKVELEYDLPSAHQPQITTSSRLSLSSRPYEILLVEDNKVNQFLGKQLLSRMNCRVTLAGNAADTLKILQQQSFDLILMDVQLPDMNGYELTRHIRNQLPAPAQSIPIVALTAYASEYEMENALRAGMNDYLTKPYGYAELAAILRKNIPWQNTETSLMAVLLQRMNNNRSDTIKLAEMILRQTPPLCTRLEKLTHQEKWKALAELAHKMKSTVGLFGMPDLLNHLNRIEEWAHELIHLDKLPNEVRLFLSEVHTCLEKLKADLEKMRTMAD